MIEILLGLVCALGVCHVEHIQISHEAAAVASCESGDTVTLGSLDWDSINVNVDGTIDQGAFQINSYWIWNAQDRWMMRPFANSIGLTSDQLFALYPNAIDAPPDIQVALFEYVWDDGYGWRHWSASRPCWSKWIAIDEHGRAVWR